jgi:hypothetical protein
MTQYAVLNTSTGKQTIYTEAGLIFALKDKHLSKILERIGECDIYGNILQDYKKHNFLNNVKKEKNPKSTSKK